MNAPATPLPADLNEQQLREQPNAWPKSEAELQAYVAALADRPHDYGTAVYALSLSTVAMFNYMASKLGMTGFQASCADLDVLRRTRHIDGPFIVLQARDFLYPQYDVPGKFEKWRGEIGPWLKEQAQAELTKENEHVAPAVRAHWQELAK